MWWGKTLLVAYRQKLLYYNSDFSWHKPGLHCKPLALLTSPVYNCVTSVQSSNARVPTEGLRWTHSSQIRSQHNTLRAALRLLIGGIRRLHCRVELETKIAGSTFSTGSFFTLQCTHTPTPPHHMLWWLSVVFA